MTMIDPGRARLQSIAVGISRSRIQTPYHDVNELPATASPSSAAFFEDYKTLGHKRKSSVDESCPPFDAVLRTFQKSPRRAYQRVDQDVRLNQPAADWLLAAGRRGLHFHAPASNAVCTVGQTASANSWRRSLLFPTPL